MMTCGPCHVQRMVLSATPFHKGQGPTSTCREQAATAAAPFQKAWSPRLHEGNRLQHQQPRSKKLGSPAHSPTLKARPQPSTRSVPTAKETGCHSRCPKASTTGAARMGVACPKAPMHHGPPSDRAPWPRSPSSPAIRNPLENSPQKHARLESSAPGI